MYPREQGVVGRTEAIATLPVGGLTMTVAALATGTVTASKFINTWLVRADAAAAERIRMCSNFASATGTLTHAGTAYTDLTATDESVEIVEHEPYLLDNAVNEALHLLRRIDRTVIPTRNGYNRYSLYDLTWLSDPADIARVVYRPSPVLTNNRYMEKWSGIGATTVDGFTLAGAGATIARNSSTVERDQYSCALTRAGTNATLSQTLRLLGIDTEDSLRGEVVTAVLRVWASVASRVRVQFYDGVNAATSSAFHTGDSTWQTLSAEVTVPSTATELTARASLETDDTTVYIDQLYLMHGTLGDGVERDNYSEQAITGFKVLQGEGPALILLLRSALPAHAQLIVETRRPWLPVGTNLAADGDSVDAPLLDAAEIAVYKLFDALAERGGQDGKKYRDLANKHWRSAQIILLGATVRTDDGREAGLPLPSLLFAPPPRRVQ